MRGTPKPQPELRAWLEDVVTQFGSDVAVGLFCGYKDGANVGRWRAGYNNPSILACLRLARARNENPLDILRLAGHKEEADLLEGHVSHLNPLPVWVPQLEAVVSMLDTAVSMMRHTGKSRQSKGVMHEPKDEEHEAKEGANRSVRPPRRKTSLKSVSPRYTGRDYQFVASTGQIREQTGADRALSASPDNRH